MTSITETITDNIVSTLAAMSTPTYDFTPGAVEQERSNLIVNNRYPFIEVAGPYGEVDQGHHTRGDMHELEYTITYLNKLNDTDISNDNPLPKQVASVVANIHKALMVDHTRGNNANMTTLREYGYINYDTDTGEHFEVFMTVVIRAIINSFDMSKLG